MINEQVCILITRNTILLSFVIIVTSSKLLNLKIPIKLFCRSWSSRITIPEIRRSNLLSIIQLLEEEEDINQITQYFSYEHFYVIYCKFWELDRDHDLFIDKQDLTRHNDHGKLTSFVIDYHIKSNKEGEGIFLNRYFMINHSECFNVNSSIITIGNSTV